MILTEERVEITEDNIDDVIKILKDFNSSTIIGNLHSFYRIVLLPVSSPEKDCDDRIIIHVTRVSDGYKGLVDIRAGYNICMENKNIIVSHDDCTYVFLQ